MDDVGVFVILIAHIAQVAIHIHDLVIAEDEVDVAACFKCFLFEMIDQPQAFGDMKAAVEEVAIEDQVAGAEGPFIGWAHDAVIDQHIPKRDEIALDV